MLDAILMIVSALMIVLSLLQSGKTDGMSGAFTGIFFVLVIVIRLV